MDGWMNGLMDGQLVRRNMDGRSVDGQGGPEMEGPLGGGSEKVGCSPKMMRGLSTGQYPVSTMVISHQPRVVHHTSLLPAGPTPHIPAIDQSSLLPARRRLVYCSILPASRLPSRR
jgi:hypothetical protein